MGSTEEIVAAAERFAAELSDAFFTDIAGRMTCSEADATIALYMALERLTDADDILRSHAAADEPGDLHYNG
jgi:hypothetical protein